MTICLRVKWQKDERRAKKNDKTTNQAKEILFQKMGCFYRELFLFCLHEQTIIRDYFAQTHLSVLRNSCILEQTQS